jgi:hypothetical protein
MLAVLKKAMLRSLLSAGTMGADGMSSIGLKRSQAFLSDLVTYFLALPNIFGETGLALSLCGVGIDLAFGDLS